MLAWEDINVDLLTLLIALKGFVETLLLVFLYCVEISTDSSIWESGYYYCLMCQELVLG